MVVSNVSSNMPGGFNDFWDVKGRLVQKMNTRTKTGRNISKQLDIPFLEIVLILWVNRQVVKTDTKGGYRW